MAKKVGNGKRRGAVGANGVADRLLNVKLRDAVQARMRAILPKLVDDATLGPRAHRRHSPIQ